MGRPPLQHHTVRKMSRPTGPRRGVQDLPEAVLTFADAEPIDAEIIRKLQSVLPEDDRCIELRDPLQLVLDRISSAANDDADVEYALNRLSTAVAPEGAESEVTTRFSVDKSFAAFMAAQRNATETFAAQIARLNEVLGQRNTGTDDRILLELAAQSGARYRRSKRCARGSRPVRERFPPRSPTGYPGCLTGCRKKSNPVLPCSAGTAGRSSEPWEERWTRFLLQKLSKNFVPAYWLGYQANRFARLRPIWEAILKAIPNALAPVTSSPA
jgi:hypothetical protein